MKRWLWISVLLGVAIAQDPNLSALRGASPQEAMRLANLWGAKVQSYVTQQAVVFKLGGQTLEVALPQDQMVLAIAPYVQHTHPCKTHFMSGCQGEMVGVPVAVVVKSGETVVFSGTVQTLPNGFIELWLPRNREYNLSLSSGGKTASGKIATFANSDTCITTFRLR